MSDANPFTNAEVRLMQRAIEESRNAANEGAMPFGAVLAVDDKEVLAARNASACTGVRGGGSDVTRHAEMELIRKACAQLTPEQRSKSTLYTSTEPCVMCAGAIYWGGIRAVVFGCSSEELQQISGPGGFDIPIQHLYSQAKPGCRKIIVRGPCLEEEALKVHRESGCWAVSSSSKTADEDTEEVAEIAIERSLLSSGIGAAASQNSTVPIIDMILAQEEVADQMWNAANEVGFFTVINHGMPQQVIESMFDASKEFFSQPLSEKETQSPFDRTLNSGYEYMAQVRPSTGTTDQKESIQITARRGCMDGRWPTHPAGFQRVSEEMISQAHKLACRIMSLLEAKACTHLLPGTLADAHTLWQSDGQCTLRLLHYPPMSVDDLKHLSQPGKVHWRAGPHTDWDNITLLFQRIGQAGLECRANPRRARGRDINWIPVPPIHGGIVVNIGDMLSRWSDGALYSNLHRVRMPSESECGLSRYSVAYFAQADKSCLIESREAAPITAGDYILSRIKSNYA